MGSGQWVERRLAAHNADALAAVQRNTALGQAISAAPGFGLRLAMGNVSLDEIGQRGSNALQLDRIDKLKAAGDYVGAQMIRTENALGIASLAVGGEGLVVGAVDLGSSLGRTAAIGTRLAAEEAAASRTMQIAGAKFEEFNYRYGVGPRYMMEPDFRVAPPSSTGGIASSTGDTVSVFRKMSDAEAEATLTTQRLQPPAPGSNSSKYLSESLNKVIAFQNNGVSSATSESVLEFVLNKPRYQDLMSTAVNQAGSKGVDAVKINFEGISDPSLRNIGVPISKLDAFNDLILQINKVDR